jgi:cytochrome c-type biogenesis protein CcmH/NrfG
MKGILLSLALLTTFDQTLVAQDSAKQQLRNVAQLAEQGRYGEIIAIAPTAMEASQLNALDRGRGWMLIAKAYQEQGQFQQATSAFEHALALLKDNQEYTDDYASALTAFSSLYRDLGDASATRRLLERALQLYKQIEDHAGIAIVCEGLAENALQRHDAGGGRKYLDRAEQEAKLTSELSNEYRIAIADSWGWVADVEGNRSAAIIQYQKALDERIRRHGRQHPSSGWGFMLLGKARLRAGDVNDALDDMREGLAILGLSAGRENIKYLVAELGYSQALGIAGQHSQEAQVKAEAEQGLEKLYKGQCAECRVSIAAIGSSDHGPSGR